MTVRRNGPKYIDKKGPKATTSLRTAAQNASVTTYKIKGAAPVKTTPYKLKQRKA